MKDWKAMSETKCVIYSTTRQLHKWKMDLLPHVILFL